MIVHMHPNNSNIMMLKRAVAHTWPTISLSLNYHWERVAPSVVKVLTRSDSNLRTDYVRDGYLAPSAI